MTPIEHFEPLDRKLSEIAIGMEPNAYARNVRLKHWKGGLEKAISNLMTETMTLAIGPAVPIEESCMTVAKLEEALRVIEVACVHSRPSFTGVPIIVDHNCLTDTEERNFPLSRHRSARVKKKLVKRFGGEFKKMAAIFNLPGRIVVHPSLYQAIKGHVS